MGGKNKKGDRVKNNARPSSSSHSAELLGDSVPMLGGLFVTQGSIFGNPEELNCNIDVNFQVAFKKMTKKDSTTKMKALQEFTYLCKNSETEVVKTILPFWPKMYCALAIDVEHRVRECAHIAHAAVVEKVKKSIAPYLKTLAGPWFTSQYDNYPPAASAATLAFEQAFPCGKQNKVIMFCQEEILNYIYEGLIKTTPQTLSNPKCTKPEEMDAKYQRIVIATLQGYNFYLQKLSSDQIKEAEESNRKIVSSPKFWEYSKNKVSQIRSIFFNVVISLCQKAKFLLVKQMKKLTVSIFNDLDDSDPIILVSVWVAALNALNFVEDCWSTVSLETQVFAKLNEIIRKGGRNAVTIFPIILPLLNKSRPDFLTDKEKFYGKLLQNIRLTLEGSTIANPSSSDGKTIAATFIECLKYIIMQNNSDTEFCTSLVSSQLVPALEKILSTPKSINSAITGPFFFQVSTLLRCWHSSDKENYSSLLKLFWESLLNSCKKTLEQETSTTNLQELLNIHLEFLKVLQKPDKYGYKPKRIKFVGDSSDGENTEEIYQNVVEKDGSEFASALLIFAKNLAGTYIKNSVENEINVYIPYLSQIVNLFDSKVIFDEFVVVLNKSSLYVLFLDFFSKWLENPHLRRGELVELCFSLLQHVKQEEKEIILKKFFDDWFNSELQYDICLSLLQYLNDDCVRCLISSKVLQLTRNFMKSDCDNKAFRDLITSIFKARDASGECVIGDRTACSIIDLLSNSLRLCNDKIHVRQLAESLILHMDLKKKLCRNSYEQLLVVLFKLSCYCGEDKDLITSCDNGLQKVLNGAESDFSEKIALATKEIILSDSVEFSLECVISRTNNFLELAMGNGLVHSSELDIMKAINTIKFFVKEPSVINAWKKRIQKCCFIGYQSMGIFDINFVELKQVQTINRAANQTAVEDLLKEVISDFESNISVLRSDGLNENHFKKVMNYFQAFSNSKCISQSEEASSKSELSPKMLITFSKWNIYAASILKHLVNYYRKHNKNLVLNEGGTLGEKQSNPTEDKDHSDDFTPEIEAELRMNKGKIVTHVCAEILDIIFSVGLIVSFSQYYAGTKYYQILGKFTIELKRIGCELLQNCNSLDNHLFYHYCNYFTTQVAEWRMIKPVLEELLNRNFNSDKLDLNEGFMENFLNTEISRSSVNDNTLSKLWCTLQTNCVFRLNENDWNKIFIYINKYFENSKPEAFINERDVTTLSVLSRITLQLMKLFDESPGTSTDERLCPESCLAWNEVVKAELWNNFFKVWQKLAEKYNRHVSPDILIAIQNVSEVITSGRATQQYLNGDNLKLMTDCIQYITSSYAVFQITSFHLLMGSVPGLVKIDTDTLCENLSKIGGVKDGSFKNSSRCSWTCENLDKIISRNQTIVETLLSNFVIGDCCSVEPFTDSFNYTYSYLLMWCFLLEVCGVAHSSLRFQYAFWLRDKGYTTSLLESIFKLMPPSVIHGTEAKDYCQRYFENYVPPSVKEPVTSERIEQISCFVYRMFLQRLPNIMSDWWNQCENKTSTLVDKVTTLYVSPILIANELKSVRHNKEGGFDNLGVKTHTNARQVVATYAIDEVKMDLIMTLPQNYPLGSIKVESSNVLVSDSNQRNWLFHISKYLTHQNGTIWEALIMWKNNLDKKFEGVEECYICASILQGSNFETPRVCCHICKKKFHSLCLYKWFTTSNSSSCPICRSLF